MNAKKTICSDPDRQHDNFANKALDGDRELGMMELNQEGKATMRQVRTIIEKLHGVGLVVEVNNDVDDDIFYLR